MLPLYWCSGRMISYLTGLVISLDIVIHGNISRLSRYNTSIHIGCCAGCHTYARKGSSTGLIEEGNRFDAVNIRNFHTSL